MDPIAVMRSFNRAYTQRIGVLDDSYLGTGRPLNVSRLLFEVGRSGSCTIRALRDRLGLDSGYASRLTAALVDEALLEVSPDPEDRRRRVVTLTDAGRGVYDELELRSQRLAERLVSRLTPQQQERFAAALATADLLIRVATLSFEEVAPDAPLARRALHDYYSELDRRFPHGFDPGPSHPEEPGSLSVAAVSEGDAVAFGGLRPLGDGIAEVKRLWTSAEWRGAGLGRRMLAHLEDLAGERGFRAVRLDTNGALHEAIRLYESSGYREIARYNDNPYAERFFEKTLD